MKLPTTYSWSFPSIFKIMYRLDYHNIELPRLPRMGAFIQSSAFIFMLLDRYESCASVWRNKNKLLLLSVPQACDLCRRA